MKLRSNVRVFFVGLHVALLELPNQVLLQPSPPVENYQAVEVLAN